ncbi:MAG: hypothetical protein QOH88_312 [Verrucomicrobiota bacterium]|jgi:hypothetical protein
MNIGPARFLVRLAPAVLIAAALSVSIPETRAIILFGTGDPTANISAPVGSVANIPWNYQGQWGGFLGTPIAPHFFVTAKHVGGGVGQVFYFQGVAYTTTATFADPSTDLQIWQVAETFPYYAPLYTNSDEVGRPLVVIGRGTQRGAEVDVKRKARGWGWGTGDSVQRWGENIVSAVISGGPNNEYIYAAFEEPAGRDHKSSSAANEATLSSGDSGGGVFLNDGGIWKLAGINYAVDGPFYASPSGAGAFFAALFDARDFYYKDDKGNYVLITGKSAVPTGFYATRISSRLTWISSVIQPPAEL